jgi:hypothetical protein
MIRPEDFPFGFASDQRRLAATFLAGRQAELIELERGGDAARARIKIFKRTLEVWAERGPDGTTRFGCDCPHYENEGTGCAHLFALCLLLEQAAAKAAAPPEPEEEDAPFEPTWVIDRGRSHARSKLWVGPYERGSDGAWKPVRVTAAVLVRATGDDERLLKLLQPAAGGRVALDKGGGFTRPEGPWPLEDDALVAALPLLIGTGRCVLDASAAALAAPIADDSVALPPKDARRSARGVGRERRVRAPPRRRELGGDPRAGCGPRLVRAPLVPRA